MNDPTPVTGDKFRRYRERKLAQGLREVRMWLPNPSDPAFRARLAADADALRGAPEHEEVMDFIEAVMADTMRDID